MQLNILIAIPILTTLLILVAKSNGQIRLVALLGGIIQLIMSGALLSTFFAYRHAGILDNFLFKKSYAWFPRLGINFAMGVDGAAVSMILLTALVVVAGILVSWKIKERVKEFFVLLTLLSTGAYGFFISLDFFTMFFFLELAVIPKFLLIGIWGSGKKEYSAMKLALMLMGGSVLLLIGMIALYFHTATGNALPTFSLTELAEHPLPIHQQYLIFPFLFVGFGVFTAIFPFHTWAPDGHSSAPTAASMFLAGISMKLGAFGCLRVVTLLMPEAATYYSGWIVGVACIAILYGSLATLMQKDLKYMNAYSSVSHCGIILLGLGMMTKTSINGAVMQMISHGLMTALFFGVIGMVYDRTHTRKIEDMSGLLKKLPFSGTVFLIAGLCSLGLPGLSGFAAEVTVFVGSWERTELAYRVATILACSSIVVTAVYILRASAKVLMGPYEVVDNPSFTDAKWNEQLAAVLLIGAILAIGVAPFWLMNLIG